MDSGQEEAMEEEIEKSDYQQDDKESLASDKIPLAAFHPSLGLVSVAKIVTPKKDSRGS